MSGVQWIRQELSQMIRLVADEIDSDDPDFDLVADALKSASEVSRSVTTLDASYERLGELIEDLRNNRTEKS